MADEPIQYQIRLPDGQTLHIESDQDLNEVQLTAASDLALKKGRDEFQQLMADTPFMLPTGVGGMIPLTGMAKDLAPTVMRIGGAVTGGIGGTLISPETPIVSQVLGGITGATLAEPGAQAMEIAMGQRPGPSFREAAINIGTAGIPGIPAGVLAKYGLGTLTKVALRAGEGALVGAGQDSLTRLARGEEQDLGESSQMGILGSLIGGGAGTLEAGAEALARLRRKPTITDLKTMAGKNEPITAEKAAELDQAAGVGAAPLPSADLSKLSDEQLVRLQDIHANYNSDKPSVQAKALKDLQALSDEVGFVPVDQAGRVQAELEERLQIQKAQENASKEKATVAKQAVSANTTDLQGETIASAAVRFSDGEIQTGVNHAKIIDGIPEDNLLGSEDGFMTSEGRFVPRDEAMEIAKANDQIKKGKNPTNGLTQEDLNAPQTEAEPIPAEVSMVLGDEATAKPKVTGPGEYLVLKSDDFETTGTYEVAKPGSKDNIKIYRDPEDKSWYFTPDSFPGNKHYTELRAGNNRAEAKAAAISELEARAKAKAPEDKFQFDELTDDHFREIARRRLAGEGRVKIRKDMNLAEGVASKVIDSKPKAYRDAITEAMAKRGLNADGTPKAPEKSVEAPSDTTEGTLVIDDTIDEPVYNYAPKKGKSAVPKLPKDLAGAKPRFGTQTLTFNSDLDRALYIVGKRGTLSARDGEYLNWLREQGIQDIPSAAKKVRDAVKKEANVDLSAENVRIPRLYSIAEPLIGGGIGYTQTEQQPGESDEDFKARRMRNTGIGALSGLALATGVRRFTGASDDITKLGAVAGRKAGKVVEEMSAEKRAALEAAIKNPETEWQYTVQRPMKPGGKGFIQIDAIEGGKNTGSSNLEDLNKLGAKLPEVPESLPQGQYTKAQIEEAINKEKNAVQIDQAKEVPVRQEAEASPEVGKEIRSEDQEVTADAVPPGVKPEDTVAKAEPQKERKTFTSQVKADALLPEIETATKESGVSNYTPIEQNSTAAEIKGAVEKDGIAASTQRVLNSDPSTSGLNNLQRTAMFDELLRLKQDQLKALEKNTPVAIKLADEIIALEESFLKNNTDLGQAISYLRRIGSSPSPVYFERRYVKALREINNRRVAQNKEPIKANPEFIAEIKKKWAEVQTLPEGRLRNLAETELRDSIANEIDKVSGGDTAGVLWGLFYANMLSGPNTQLVNFVSTGYNTMAKGMLLAAQDPKAAKSFFQDLGTALRNSVGEFESTLSTGQALRARSDMAQAAGSALARTTPDSFPKGLGFLSYWKYVPRFMSAVDQFWYATNYEGFIRSLAHRTAKLEGLEGAKLTARVNELTGLNEGSLTKSMEQNYAKASAEVDAAVKSGALKLSPEGIRNNKMLRAYELVDKERSDSVFNAARQYSLDSTFNNVPQGFLGSVSNGIQSVTQDYPAARFIVPFTRIVANVTNTFLDYTPLGAYRAISNNGGYYANKFKPLRAIGSFERQRLVRNSTVAKAIESGNPEALVNYAAGDARESTRLAESAMGTAAFMALAAPVLSAAAGGDGIEMTGQGPPSPRQAAQLREAGWKPYSVRIGDTYYSYLNTPMAIPFAVLGNYADNVRYRQQMESVDGLHRVAYAMSLVPKAIISQSFLKGLSDLFTSLGRDSVPQTNIFADAANTAQGFIVPRAVAQISRIFNPEIYTKDDIAEGFFRDTPVAWVMNKPSLNVLGDPVNASSNLYERLGSRFISQVTEDKDPLLRLLAEKNVFIPNPAIQDVKLYANGMIYEPNPEQFYEFSKRRGQIIKSYLSDPDQVAELRKLEPAILDRVIKRVAAGASNQAKAEISVKFESQLGSSDKGKTPEQLRLGRFRASQPVEEEK